MLFTLPVSVHNVMADWCIYFIILNLLLDRQFSNTILMYNIHLTLTQNQMQNKMFPLIPFIRLHHCIWPSPSFKPKTHTHIHKQTHTHTYPVSHIIRCLSVICRTLEACSEGHIETPTHPWLKYIIIWILCLLLPPPIIPQTHMYLFA